MVGFARASRLLAQHAQYLMGASVELRPMVEHGVIRCMMGQTHTWYRRILLAGMRPELATILEPQLRAIVREALADLAAARVQTRAGVTPLAATCELITTRAMIGWVCGVGPTHPTAQALHARLLEMGPAEMPGNRLLPHQRAGFDGVGALMRETAEAQRPDAGWAEHDGVLPRLLKERPEDVDDTVLGNLAYALQQGRYDMGGLLRWVTKYLTDEPAVLAELRSASHRSTASAPTLAEAVVMETLRLDQATALHRVALEELVFDGFRIPKDAFVKIPLREVHQDPHVFDDPERFDPWRFIGRSYAADEYAPFGLSEHRCLGSHLVMKVATLLVEELASGYSWVQTGDSTRTMGRYHWEPAPTFDLRLSPLAAPAVSVS
ncbi:MAG: cytochrome P450 [Vicinamibacterales bacterium]